MIARRSSTSLRPSISLRPSTFAAALAVLLSSGLAAAQSDPASVDPETDPAAPAPPTAPLPTPVVEGSEGTAPAQEEEPKMSEGRMLVSLYNSGFQWGISPGILFSSGKTGFFLGLRFGYGIDTGPVIVVPGVRLAGYFMDPNVYVGMPTAKLVFPLDRFAPFVEGGAGLGHVADPSKTGFAWMGGGGFMIHFTHIAFGAEASYQKISGTGFSGISVGPILAFGF